MANYHSIKNAGLAKPAASTDLGSSSNKYGNLFLDGNITLGSTVVNSNNVINPKIASISYTGDDTATSTAGGQTVTLNGAGFNSGATVLIGTTPATSTTVVSSTQITFVPPATAAGTYVLYVINPDGGTATFVTGISFSGTPTWTTSAGSLGTVINNNSVNLSVAATGDASVTYAVKAGSSLPSGLSLNTSTGAITGTAPSPASSTVYNFTLTAIDGQNQDTDRAFSISLTVKSPPVVDYLVVAGGGAGGSVTDMGAGGGAGGYLTANVTLALSTSYTITVGGGGNSGSNGSNSSISGSGFSTVTSIGGGEGGKYETGGYPGAVGKNGGSGGGLGGKGVYPGSTYISAPRQGYDGGTYNTSGGGGAGQVGGGQEGTINGLSNGGRGGNGLDWLGLGTYYAGGGGAGGTYGPGGGGGTGGAGGGGEGHFYQGSYINPTAGGTNSGGGGGGGGRGGNGAAGGSGVVIIRYADSYDAAISTTGSPTITVAGGYRTYKFTQSGSITF